MPACSPGISPRSAAGIRLDEKRAGERLKERNLSIQKGRDWRQDGRLGSHTGHEEKCPLHHSTPRWDPQAA